MAVALTKKVIIIQYKLGKFDEKSPIFAGQPGVQMSVEHIHGDVNTSRVELPVKGCIDYEVINDGSAKVYLFDGAIVILPGQNWTPPKSSPLPLINNPFLTFEGDFQQTRSVADLVLTPPSA